MNTKSIPREEGVLPQKCTHSQNTNKRADAPQRSHPHGFPDKGTMATFPCPAPVQNKGQENAGGLPQTVLPNTFPPERGRQSDTLAGAAAGVFLPKPRARHAEGEEEEQPGQACCSTQPHLSLLPAERRKTTFPKRNLEPCIHTYTAGMKTVMPLQPYY